MTRPEAIEYLKRVDFITPQEQEARDMAIKALEEQTRIEKELHGKTPEEQLEFLRWFMLDYPRWFTQSHTALIDWLKGENRWLTKLQS